MEPPICVSIGSFCIDACAAPNGHSACRLRPRIEEWSHRGHVCTTCSQAAGRRRISDRSGCHPTGAIRAEARARSRQAGNRQGTGQQGGQHRQNHRPSVLAISFEASGTGLTSLLGHGGRLVACRIRGDVASGMQGPPQPSRLTICTLTSRRAAAVRQGHIASTLAAWGSRRPHTEPHMDLQTLIHSRTGLCLRCRRWPAACRWG